jgi:K+-sensing histidine kinase KdpD
MLPDTPNDQPHSYEQLLRENQELRRELENRYDSQRYIWKLFVEIARRLQLSSASVKAAVSSLLSYDIFWDPANQHEFLQTIDASTNTVARLIMLMTLAFRAEAGSLTLSPEPQVLQEILAVVQRNIAARFPNLSIDLEMPENGKTVQVDYEYLIMAIGYLLELLDADPEIRAIQITAHETNEFWNLDIQGLTHTTLELIHTMHACKTDQGMSEGLPFSPEDILGLHIACEVLHLQRIDVRIVGQEGAHLLRLMIPAASKI